MERPSPEEYQPRLRWWSQLWRLALCVTLSLLVWLNVAEHQLGSAWPLFVVDLGVGLASYVLVLFRRRWPVAVALVTNAMSAISGVAAGPATLAAVSLATRRRLAPIGIVSLLAVLASTAYAEIQPDPDRDPFWLTFTSTVIAVAATTSWGMYIGSRRELLWTLRHRAERAEAEQELRVAQARSNERARIAREMHDVLAHRISQISMHAGALGFREDLTPEEVRVSAGVIREKAHEALTDLRGVLGVLRDEHGSLLDAPQPTYDDLPGLVEEARGSGLRVEFVDELDPARCAVPDAVGRTVYRIVQEGMTNARKHAPGSLLRIRVAGSPEDGLDVWLSNPLGFGASGTPGSGLGLVGLSERAEIRGGRLEHRREGSSFVLHGWIPWAA